MKEYLIDFESIFVDAGSEDEAYEKALDYIKRREVQVANIEEN